MEQITFRQVTIYVFMVLFTYGIFNQDSQDIHEAENALLKEAEYDPFEEMAREQVHQAE